MPSQISTKATESLSAAEKKGLCFKNTRTTSTRKPFYRTALPRNEFEGASSKTDRGNKCRLWYIACMHMCVTGRGAASVTVQRVQAKICGGDSLLSSEKTSFPSPLPSAEKGEGKLTWQCGTKIWCRFLGKREKNNSRKWGRATAPPRKTTAPGPLCLHTRTDSCWARTHAHTHTRHEGRGRKGRDTRLPPETKPVRRDYSKDRTS